MEKMRVDVWLWAVRQLKSRSLATTAARAGHVRINGVRAKASAKIKIGDEVRLRVDGFDRVLQVKQLIPKRLSASLVKDAYEDTSPPRVSLGVLPTPIYRPRGAGRPSKKERRELDALRGWDSTKKYQ